MRSILLIISFSLMNLNCNPKLGEKEVVLKDSFLNSEYKKRGFEYWKPKNTELEKAHQILDIFNNETLRYERGANGYENYYLQFIPYIDNVGHKFVYVNAFCQIINNENIDWKNEIVIVKGGGSCYWQVEINLDTGKYDFNINGEY